MKGNDVKQLQNALIALGYNLGMVDGIFGPRTQSSVLAFQLNNRLLQDGVVGPLTVVVLNKALTEPAILKVGSRGPEVATIQSALKKLGYGPQMVDGIFGTETRAAVISFQKDYGLTEDGIAGSQTFTVLGQVLRQRTR